MLVIAAFGAPAHAQPRNLSLQFMAPDANWTDRSVTGRAFICIQLKSETGLSEDCFGFYQRKSGKALVGGPGVVDKEFDFSKTPPARFVQVKASMTTPITAARRQRLLAFIKGFDKDFSLTPANCVTFANGIARLAGLKTPGSTSLTPVQYPERAQKAESFLIKVGPCQRQRHSIIRSRVSDATSTETMVTSAMAMM